MVSIQRVTKNTPISEINSILDRDGCVVIENLLSSDEVQTLKGELSPHFDKVKKCHGDFFGYETKRFSGLISKSETSQKMAIQSTILAVMDNFLLKSCSEYQLNLTQAISIGPGEPQQIIHTDDLMFPFDHKGHESMINCMWAVDDFKKENGATHVVPGSHKWKKDRLPEPDEILQAEMPAGSVLIYFGSLIHSGGANKTDKSRTGLVISYCLGWLKQAENQFLSTPIAIAKNLPERLQRLIGYFVHKPNLGCVEGQDPIKLLSDEDIISCGFEEFIPDSVKPIIAEYRENIAKAA